VPALKRSGPAAPAERARQRQRQRQRESARESEKK